MNARRAPGLRAGIAGLALLCAASAAGADGDLGPRAARELRAAGEILPLEQVMDAAAALHPGQVLEAELKRRGDAYVYEVELVDHAGVVWELHYDARTGRLLDDTRER